MTDDLTTLRIRGGMPLRGEVTLSGCKNGALPVLAACLLVSDEVLLRRVPRIADVERLCDLLRQLGARVSREDDTVRVDARGLSQCRPDRDLCASMRASFYVLGPLLARFGAAEVPMPGGCAIGARPVDYIVRAIERLGVEMEERSDVVVVSAPRGLAGATVTLDPAFRSPGATFNVLMAAATARGRTVIENASRDPEVEGLCAFLNACGAQVSGAGGNRLIVEGQQHLHGCEYTILSDRIEAGTYLLAGAATRGEVTVAPILPQHLDALLNKLEEMGVEVVRTDESVTVRAPERLRGAEVYTAPYPGFPTDLQAPMVALMCVAEGESTMHERIYDGRLHYVQELRRMGARIRLESNQQAVIEGVPALEGRVVNGADIRATAALVIAGLAAQGETGVSGRRFLLRGYERMEEKLLALGARLILPSPDAGPAAG